MDIWQILNITSHVLAGSLLLLLGVGSLVTVKGSAKHRWYGRRLTWCYAVVLLSAIIGVIFFRSPPALAAVTVSATYGFISGYRALVIKNTGPLVIDQTLALVALGFCGYLFMLMHSGGSESWPPAMGYSTISITVLYTLYDLSRVLWRSRWLEVVWPIDHGVKMVGAYFAAASAASGNLLRGFQPWSQVMPSVIGTLVTLWFIFWFFYIRKPKAKPV